MRVETLSEYDIASRCPEKDMTRTDIADAKLLESRFIYNTKANMLDSDEEYCLTLEQKSIAVLIDLRCNFVTVDEVLAVKKDISCEDAKEIAQKCNEMICNAKRYLLHCI